jgi:hypothetical protein
LIKQQQFQVRSEMIENGKKYDADELIKICAQNKLYYKYTRYDREDHSTEQSFVFHDELQPLLDSIDSEMKRHCWDCWQISCKRSGLSLNVTIKAIYSTRWLSISVATDEQMNAVETLVQKKMDWKKTECECKECIFRRTHNCEQCNACHCCCKCDKSSSSASKSDSESDSESLSDNE